MEKKPEIKIPEYMMRKLRGRRNLEFLDKSQDDDIRKMDSVQIVRDCVAWELGDPSWASTIAAYMVAVGAKPEDFSK